MIPNLREWGSRLLVPAALVALLINWELTANRASAAQQLAFQEARWVEKHVFSGQSTDSGLLESISVRFTSAAEGIDRAAFRTSVIFLAMLLAYLLLFRESWRVKIGVASVLVFAWFTARVLLPLH